MTEVTSASNTVLEQETPSVLTPEQEEEQAERVQRAKVGVVFRLPYLATPLFSLPIAPASLAQVSTFATDGERILFSPRFAATLSDMEIRGVLLHELMHVLLEHQTRRQTRDSRLWNFACDFAVNLILKDMQVALPKDVLYSPKFRGLTAEQIYEQLLREQEAQSEEQDLSREEVQRRFSQQNPGYPRSGHRRGASREERAQEEDPRIQRDGVGRLPSGLDADLQDFPPEVQAREDLQPGISKENFKATLKKWREDLNTQFQGTEAGGWEEEIRVLNRYGLDWVYLLQNWLTEQARDEWRLWPPSKKHVWRGIYLPSFGGVSLGKVAIAIDTSGSMSTQELGRVLAEVKVFRETFHSPVIVLEVDAEIQRIREYDPFEPFLEASHVALMGRGGTDTCPVFEWLQTEAASSVRGLIYITDGYACFPEKAPDIPVIWLLTSDIDEKNLPRWGVKAYVS